MYCNVAGEHEKTFQLDLVLVGGHEVSCCPDYIFVTIIYPVSMDVYSWAGCHIQTLSDEQLDIGKDDMIHEIQCNHDGTVLQLVIGDRDRVHSLHAYKVRFSFLLSSITHGFIILP